MPFKLLYNQRYSAPPAAVGFGSEPFDAPTPKRELYYAFAIAEGASPRVFRFETDEDGVQSLANLVRSEDVLQVVRGHPVEIATASVVEFSSGGETTQHRLEV